MKGDTMNVSSNSRIADGSEATIRQVELAAELQIVSGGEHTTASAVAARQSSASAAGNACDANNSASCMKEHADWASNAASDTGLRRDCHQLADAELANRRNPVGNGDFLAVKNSW
jgi:hypothetical protein